MPRVMGKWVLLVLGLALLTLNGRAQADEKGEALLKKTDQTLRRWKTLDLEYSLVTQEPGRNARHMKVRSRFKGNKQLTEILAPADMKGTKALTLSKTKMYVYMPSFRKMRRVASHTSEQGFMGNTYSQQDMNMTSYGEYYTGQFVSENDSSWTLMLTKRPDKSAPYARIELTVDKQVHLPTRIRLFDDQGTHIKTETRRDHQCDQQVCLPRVQRMTDHTKNNKYSELTLVNFKINPPIPDSLFSKRSLQK